MSSLATMAPPVALQAPKPTSRPAEFPHLQNVFCSASPTVSVGVIPSEVCHLRTMSTVPADSKLGRYHIGCPQNPMTRNPGAGARRTTRAHGAGPHCGGSATCHVRDDLRRMCVWGFPPPPVRFQSIAEPECGQGSWRAYAPLPSPPPPTPQ